ncbi:MAG: hypothetical protein M1833_000305 [Piccolia ochrophora]|nr:MAG: hypothetical protein M1833_000305 [Piccolia ochrophora]
MANNADKAGVNQSTVKADDTSYMEHGHSEKSPGFGTKLKNHFRRFWWLHLIIFIICTLVIVLPLIYVGFPRIAQKGVNDSGLEIRSMAITDPTSDSIHFRQEAILTSDSTYHPTLDGFNASVSLADSGADGAPFVYLMLPPVAATEEATIMVDQDVSISNLDGFTDYSVKVMNEKEFDIVIRGRTGLKQTGLKKIQVDYDKTVTIKGLNKLEGFDVTSTELLPKRDEDGYNMVGTVYIPNASDMTLVMGNLTMDLLVEDEVIGTSTIENLILKPGNNTVPMRSKTETTKVLMLLPKYPDGLLPIDIKTNSTIYNGQHLTYYEEALRSNPKRVMLNVTEALGSALNP